MAAVKLRIHAFFALIAVTVLFVGLAALPLSLPYLNQHRELLKSVRAWLRGAHFLGDEDVVLQAHWNDCGAATLQMVLAAHGIKRDISALHYELRTTERGTSLFNLRLVATHAGLRGRSWVLSVADLTQVPLPAIAFVNGDHFVVFRRFLAPNVLEVDDPALGRLRWPVRSFRKVWSGEMLVFDPTWIPKGGV